MVEIKALACELPAASGRPLARWQCADLARAAVEQGIVASISDTTIWRWLSADAIKPWQHRSWIFPRDPDFAAKAGRVLDLYHRRFDNKPLRPDEYVISTDEKTSIQARCRCHPTLPPGPGQPARVEHEYRRKGALAYLAALDVHHARVLGRCEDTTGIVPFSRLVEQVMTTEPYASARRVYWIADNGSSHRGQASIDRMAKAWPTAKLVHLPIHASWLNQIEIYFSIIQRKVLAPNDFHDLQAVADRLLGFQDYWQSTGTPFDWKFTRTDLNALLDRINDHEPLAAAA
ncbi:MAG: IS630 family transposase [Thermocrispum sp.]